MTSFSDELRHKRRLDAFSFIVKLKHIWQVTLNHSLPPEFIIWSMIQKIRWDGYTIRNWFQYQVLNHGIAPTDTLVDHSLNIVSNFEEILDFFFFLLFFYLFIFFTRVAVFQPAFNFSNSTIETPEQCQWRHQKDVNWLFFYFVNFEQISYILGFPMLTLNK